MFMLLSYCFTLMTGLLLTAAEPAKADESLWTDEQRAERSDAVFVGTVKSVEEVEELGARETLKRAVITIEKNIKNPELAGRGELAVYYESPMFDKASSRCPTYAELWIGRQAQFYVHLRKVGSEWRAFLEMGGDVGPLKKPEGPEKLIEMLLYIGGFQGPRYTVIYQDEELKYRATGKGNGDKDWETIKGVDEDRLIQFVKTIDGVGVFGWDERYVRDNVADGTQWRVCITTTHREFVASGNNDYPGEETGLLHPGKPFTDYLKAVQDLIGGDRRFQ